MARASLSLILTAPLLLAACDAPNGPATAPRTAGTKVSNIDRVCAASQLSSFVGQNVNAVDLSGNDPMRILPPGTPMTMDYNPSRLNVELDEAGTIVRFYCG